MSTTPIEKARAARQAMADAGIRVQVKTPLEKLADNPTSLHAVRPFQRLAGTPAPRGVQQ